MEANMAPTLHIWHPDNVTIIEYDSDNYLNTWIPTKWISHDKDCQHEQARIIDIQILLQHSKPILIHSPQPKSKLQRLFRRSVHFLLNRFRTNFITNY